MTTKDAGANATDALTESKLLELGQAVFEGGDPSVFMIKPADAQIVASFTGAAGRYRNFAVDDQKTLTNVIDLYVGPYGEYKIILNRHQMTTHALADLTMWRSAVLRPFSALCSPKLATARSISSLANTVSCT